MSTGMMCLTCRKYASPDEWGCRCAVQVLSEDGISPLAEKLYIGGVDPEMERCLRCGSMHLDTGWECNDCGYDNMPHYVPPKDEPRGRSDG